MDDFQKFRIGLNSYVADSHARPFVCTGSPLECRSFVVGFNPATRLTEPFSSYWSDRRGFNREKFDYDYKLQRPQSGNRPRIEAIAKEIAPCLETNLYAIPSEKAKQLKDRPPPVICYLFVTIKPERVFVHSKAAIRFFEENTGCRGFTIEPKRELEGA